MNQNQVYNVVDSIAGVKCFYRCLIYLPQPHHRSPYWQWTLPDHTTVKPMNKKLITLSLGKDYTNQMVLTTSRKKSTWGLLCTKNLTGCLSIVTLTVKSYGVPGFTVFLGIAIWCEWMRVSSKSNTKVFLWTMVSRCRDTGDNGNSSYFTGWYWIN